MRVQADPAGSEPPVQAPEAVQTRRRPLIPAGLRSAPVLVLAALMAAYVVTFGFLTWRQQRDFGTFGFDMGIYDQGIWLLSQGRSPFVTVRGLQFFGHHVNLIALLLAPFYRLGAGPTFLYLVETVWLAAGAVPLWLLARDKLSSPWAATAIGGAYLLHPTIQWINWWHFHPDALMITPLLFAVWLAERRRWGWFAVAVGVTLLCKEDAGLAIFGLGAMLAVRRQWRAGLVTALVGAGWFAFAAEVIIPHANGGAGPLYATLFPGFGSSVSEVALNMLRHPGQVLHELALPERRKYYQDLLLPAGLVAFASPSALLIGLPQLFINSLSGHVYTYNAHYYYSSVVVASIFVATVDGCARLRRTRLPKVLPVVVVAVAALVANVVMSPSPLSDKNFHSGIWATDNPRQARMREAVAMIPPDAGVSATYYLVPHLTHRAKIYEYPNPWRVANWGVAGEHPPDPRGVDYIVVDWYLLGQDATLMSQLIGPGGGFKVWYSRDGIVVAVRDRAVPGQSP